ncbi:hypothetical protein BDV95DRAFT_565007 [Massariosphaeria phaeospora]|uniref:Uncharacterized protein n=1 Tax=Massariosphaeria phaeospora TaxID=100035 RepID=A0A7C8MRK4_9PLEO|nr:hypothetical protein BDV95DRAFT_565007 [Massariosphaeria phaeospora]
MISKRRGTVCSVRCQKMTMHGFPPSSSHVHVERSCPNHTNAEATQHNVHVSAIFLSRSSLYSKQIRSHAKTFYLASEDRLPHSRLSQTSRMLARSLISLPTRRSGTEGQGRHASSLHSRVQSVGIFVFPSFVRRGDGDRDSVPTKDLLRRRRWCGWRVTCNY